MTRPAILHIGDEVLALETRCMPCRGAGSVPDAMWVAVADKFADQYGHRMLDAAMLGMRGPDQQAAARGLWVQAGVNPDATPPPTHTCQRCYGAGYALTADGAALADFIKRVTGEIR